MNFKLTIMTIKISDTFHNMYSGGCFYYKKGSEIVWSDKNIPADARKPYAKMIRYGLHSYHSPHSYIASMLVYRGAYNTVKKGFIT